MSRWTKLHPELQSETTRSFEKELSKKVVGQERAVRQLVRLFQTFTSGLSYQRRPLGVYLLLGPTGTGKTLLAESMAEFLFGSPESLTKVDCAEFQREHEVSKLIGAPPGYLGHRETKPKITQEILDSYVYRGQKMALVLFDEIEKASNALFDLLLSIMDKGNLSTGTNQTIDFTNTVIFLTSNLGAREVSEMLGGGIGYVKKGTDVNKVDQDIYKLAYEAAKKHFSPEFINRLDRVVVFRSLQRPHMEHILNLELEKLQNRIIASTFSAKFILGCHQSAKNFLIGEGFDSKFGARPLKRAIEKYLVAPLGNLLSTEQIDFGDLVEVRHNSKTGKLEFFRKDMSVTVGGNTSKPGKGPAEPESEIFLKENTEEVLT